MVEYKYKAFISYSHKDQKWASWLHRRLETYAFPKAAIGRSTPLGFVPKNLKPIFRDREELAAADNLGDKIESALEASENLIIICSPHAEQSHWVNQEILYFKRHNRGAKIFSVIVDGEPFADGKPDMVECLPEALRFQVGNDGDLTNEPAEPLAADLRPEGDGKRLGTLKLISGMVGLGLDDLVQRDLARARSRVMAITTGALATVLAMGTLTWFAMDARQEAEARKESAEKLVDFMIGDLREKLEPVGRIDVMDGVANEAINYYEDQEVTSLGCAEKGRWARAINLAAEVAVTKGKNNEFKKFSDEAFDLTAKNIVVCEQSLSSIYDHAQSAFWSGYSALLENKLHKAKSRFLLYKNLAEDLLELSPTDPVYLNELASATVNLGIYEIGQSEYSKALTEFDRAIEIYASIVGEESINEDAARNHADTLGWKAKALSQLGDIEASKANRISEVKAANKILSKINADDWEAQYIKYSAIRALARIDYLQKKYLQSIEYGSQCEAGFSVLVKQDKINDKWKKGLALCQTLLSEAFVQNGSVLEGQKTKARLDFTISTLSGNSKTSVESLKAELGI